VTGFEYRAHTEEWGWGRWHPMTDVDAKREDALYHFLVRGDWKTVTIEDGNQTLQFRERSDV
jgi:hypothetical protein